MVTTETKATILIVDDAPENIDILRGLLKDEYKIKVAINGAKALKIAQSTPDLDLILLDVMMPDMDGYEVCRQLKSQISTASIPVIFVTAKGETDDETLGFDLGAVDYITKPISPPVVKKRVQIHLALHNEKRLLEALVLERTQELEASRKEIIACLGKAAEYKDNDTGMHVERMSHYAKVIGLATGMTEEEACALQETAPMHDIGKIGLPDYILQKPAKLNEDEIKKMREHPQIGVDILGGQTCLLLNMARSIAISHHEKWDGTGYPYGLKGEDIPLHGRIAAIADVFDALTTKRPYKEAWPVEEAVQLLKEESGKHFDPQLIKLFIEVLPNILEVKKRYQEPPSSQVSIENTML
jgi:putative two-component system response regulator